MNTNVNCIKIDFPLRGEWSVPTSPADRVPSHGTVRMGLTYAFDFLQVRQSQTSMRSFRGSLFRRIMIGVPINHFYCWGEKIYAPLDGEAVYVTNETRERKISYWISDSLRAMKNALFFDEKKDKFEKIAGNYVIIKCGEGIFIALVHLQSNSIQVSMNQKIPKGCYIGNVGHSGNSTEPHLHFQVMDSDKIDMARGIPCVFKELEYFEGGRWILKKDTIPAKNDRFRFLK